MAQSIMLTGYSSYLGYNISSQLQRSHRFALDPTTDENAGTSQSVDDMTQAFREQLNTQHIDWILITPYPDVGRRSKVFLALREVLSGAVMANKLPSIMFFSHVGADEMAIKDGREILAQLFDFEKFLVSTLKASKQAIVVIRVAMLQEQLFFLLPSIHKKIWPLPTKSCNINPVAIQDVIDFTREVIDPRNGQQVHRQIFTLTGHEWSRERDRLFRFLKKYNIDDSPQQSADLFLYHGEATKQFYGNALNALRRRSRRTVEPPLWPSDVEVRLIKEYLWYAGWKGDPAAAISLDFEYLLNRKPRSAQGIIEVMIDVSFK